VLLAIVTSVAAAALGFYVSFLESWPTGPVMVAMAAGLWPLAVLVRSARRLLTTRS
jgi:ABC-type Mn2+/Zn2+ transport system permease subunit